jgi:hypothetical protein
MNDKEFIESVFEIAFGEDAIKKGFSKAEVIARIQEYSDESLEYEEQKQAFWRYGYNGS